MKTPKLAAWNSLSTQKHDFMKNVAKDIIKMNIKDDDSLATLRKKFYSVMKKHGIKKSITSTGEMRMYDNSEWTMARLLFYDVINSNFTYRFLIGDDIPKNVDR